MDMDLRCYEDSLSLEDKAKRLIVFLGQHNVAATYQLECDQCTIAMNERVVLFNDREPVRNVIRRLVVSEK